MGQLPDMAPANANAHSTSVTHPLITFIDALAHTHMMWNARGIKYPAATTSMRRCARGRSQCTANNPVTTTVEP